jgi:hypothetical protein
VDPNLVGISPNALADMASGLDRNLKDAIQLATSLRSAFAQADIPTDTIDSIYRTLGIAQDELPMLRRRHALALKIDDDNGNPFRGNPKLPKGMVVQGAGAITFTSDERAAAAGKSDARALKSALDQARPPAEIRPLLQRLKTNAGDSAYADALVALLGPQGVAQVSAWGLGAKQNGQPGDAKLAFSGMGGVLAAASHHLADPGKWLGDLRLSPGGPDTPRGYPTKAVAPLLQYGDFDPTFLEQVGKRELRLAPLVHDAERSKEIWDALARSPQAAALLYQLDMPDVADYTNEKRPLVHGEVKTLAEFAKVARAATMGIRKVDSHEADASVTALVNYYKSHPEFHAYDQLRNVYADLTVERWNDIVYSISTPANELTAGGDPTRVGVELPPTAWKNFLTDIMRHTPAAAEVLNKERSWANNADLSIYKNIMHTPDGAEPDKWERTAIAEMNALFKASVADALAQLKQKDQQLADGWLKDVTTAFSEVKKNNVDLAGYFKDSANLLKAREATKLQEYAKSLMKKYFGDPDVAGVGNVTAGDDYRGRWQHHAVNAWEAALAENGGRLPSVEYGGHSWTGDPSHYEKKYNTKFTYVGSDKKVHLIDPGQIGNGTKEHNYLDGWQQLKAYNEWLKDPAVVRMLAKGSGGDVSEHADGN